MAIHLIIAGHGPLQNGGFDPGATGYISKGEHRYMRDDLFPAMEKYAKDSKDTFIFHTEYKVLDRANLASLAKKHNADTVTEFHYDATGTSKASGGHVIVHEDFEPDELDLRIRDVIEDVVGTRYYHKGHKGISGRASNELGMVRMAKNNGINFRLPELGFGTNKRDAEIMVERVDEYARKLVEAYDGVPRKPKANVAPKTTPKPKPTTKAAEYKGNSIVDFLNLNANKHLGGSSFKNRQRLAEKYGIKNYQGTSTQNLQLLDKLRSDVKPVKTTSANKNVTSYTGGSIVDYLNLEGNKHLGGSSFNNRKRLAALNGIDDYTGSANQNLQLLNKLRGGKTSKPSYVGKRVESIHNGSLRFYNKPSWSDRHVAGTITKGYGFPTIVRKLKVEGSDQYEVKNSRGKTFYITASPKYVKVV